MQNNGWLYNLREIAAIAFTPVVSTILCVLIYIFAYGNWSSDMERTRLELLGGHSHSCHRFGRFRRSMVATYTNY